MDINETNVDVNVDAVELTEEELAAQAAAKLAADASEEVADEASSEETPAE